MPLAVSSRLCAIAFGFVISWSLSVRRISCFILVMVTVLPMNGGATTIMILSDQGDGTLFDGSNITAGTRSNGDTDRIGIAGNTGTREKANAIYFFGLPSLNPGNIVDAQLAFTFEDFGTDSTFNSDPFSLDIWGLGFQSTTTLDVNWLVASDTDGAAGVGISSRAKIEDNILDSSVSNPECTPVTVTTSTAGNANLVTFLQTVYGSGASPGDFAIVRLNHDIDQGPEADGTPGYTVGFNDIGDGFPELSITVIPEPGLAGLLMAVSGLGICLVCARQRA